MAPDKAARRRAAHREVKSLLRSPDIYVAEFDTDNQTVTVAIDDYGTLNLENVTLLAESNGLYLDVETVSPPTDGDMEWTTIEVGFELDETYTIPTNRSEPIVRPPSGTTDE